MAITLSKTNELIGDLGLCIKEGATGMAEIGFTIASEHQRRGYASEAVNGLLDRLFDTRMVRKVAAITDTRNTASIGVLQRWLHAGSNRIGHVQGGPMRRAYL